MVKDNPDSKRKNPQLLFPISSKIILYVPFHTQDSTYDGICYISIVEHCLEREIAQWIHHEGSFRCPITPLADALSRSYVSGLCEMSDWSGQVKSECLTCTFRASCCSARLSRVQVPAFFCPGQEKKGRGRKGVRAVRPESVAGGGWFEVLWNFECPVGLSQSEICAHFNE